jgi:hypothetical protein
MLHTPLSIPYEAQNNVQPQSRNRHRQAASVGKKHFKIAPTLLDASSSTSNAYHYDEQWSKWMSHAGSGHKDQASTYSAGWQKWMNEHTPVAPSNVLFEEVPRVAMLPIMSRLPLRAGEEDVIAAEPSRAGNLDYLVAGQDKVGGVHPEEGVASTPDLQYTRARLPELDEDSFQLWKSLHSLRSLSDDYAEGYGDQKAKKGRETRAAPHPVSEDMDEGQCPAFAENTSTSSKEALALLQRLFNWDDLPSLPEDVEYTWYGVAFRSKRRVGSESMNFYEDDRRSHEEAVNSGGLLMYWYGSPSEKTGHNLATCIWTSRADALKASSLPLHARAAVHSRKAYESFELSRYAIRKVQGETKLRLEEWVE